MATTPMTLPTAGMADMMAVTTTRISGMKLMVLRGRSALKARKTFFQPTEEEAVDEEEE